MHNFNNTVAMCIYILNLMQLAQFYWLPEVELWDIFILSAYPHPTKTYSKSCNAPIHINSSTIKNVVLLTSEVLECYGIFHNCTTAIGICNAFIGMVHRQNCTDFVTDNSTANSLDNSKMRVKHSKSWDIKYHCLRDRTA